LVLQTPSAAEAGRRTPSRTAGDARSTRRIEPSRYTGGECRGPVSWRRILAGPEKRDSFVTLPGSARIERL
jgi:hypothetical protein